jgi:hypothetical protein
LTNAIRVSFFFGPHGLGFWHNEEMRLAIQRWVSAKERKLRVLPVILPGGGRAKESPGRSDLDSSQKHGMAVGGYGGASHQFTFKLTPQTTYWQGGKQVTVASIQKGATVQVTATHEVAFRVDIL